jgi:peptide/nickel transport system substrate-binding protein
MVAMLCLVWVAAAAGARTAATKPTLNIGETAFISLDTAKDVFRNHTVTHEPFIYMNADGSFRPGLATSWRYLKPMARSGRANKDFELTLRRNARFSDGAPVTAQAVKAWLEYFPKGNGPHAGSMGPISSVETIGRWTVRIHLKSPNPVMPYTLSDQNNWGAISSPNAIANPALMATNTYGAGPYKLEPAQTVMNDHYTFVPNPYYYDKSKIKWSKVVLKVISTPTSALQALQAGQVDFVSGDPTTAGAAARSGFTVVHAPFANWGFTLDVAGVVSKPLADVRVRQALNYALDRKTIAASLYGRYGRPTSALLTPDGTDPKYTNYYSYNPGRAKALLAAAGYPNGFALDEVVVHPAGVPLAQAVAKYLGDVGVKLNLDVKTTVPAYGQAVLGNTKSPMIQALMAYFRPMWAQYVFVIKPGSSFNRLRGGWHDRTINNLWLKGQRAAKPTTYWKQITARLTSQALFMALSTTDGIIYASKKVKGVVATPNRVFQSIVELSPR